MHTTDIPFSASCLITLERGVRLHLYGEIDKNLYKPDNFSSFSRIKPGGGFVQKENGWVTHHLDSNCKSFSLFKSQILHKNLIEGKRNNQKKRYNKIKITESIILLNEINKNKINKRGQHSPNGDVQSHIEHWRAFLLLTKKEANE